MFSKLAKGLREMSSYALRASHDSRPIRWWEYLLLLVSIPYCVAGGIGLLLGVLIGKRSPRDEEFNAFYQAMIVNGNKIRTVMRSNNRYLTIAELDVRDLERAGTILVDEQGLTWWTADDVVALAPVECNIRLPYSGEFADARSDYARYCHKRYFDFETGIAYLLNSYSDPGNIQFDWPQERVVQSRASMLENQTLYLLMTHYDLQNYQLENPSESEDVVERNSGTNFSSLTASSGKSPLSAASQLPVEAPSTRHNWPIFSRQMMIGFVTFCVLVILPLMLNWSMPDEVLFMAAILLVFVDVLVLMPIYGRIRAGVESNEYYTVRRQYVEFILVGIFVLLAVFMATGLLMSYPSLWLTFAPHAILVASLHWFPGTFFYDPHPERREELSEIAPVASG